MTKFVLLDARIFAGGADLTSVSNTVELSCEAEEKDTTPFGNGGWKESLPGLFSTEINGGGQWEAGDAAKVDDSAWSAMTGRLPVPWTVCPGGADLGDLAYLTEALRTEYKVGDEVGEVAPWEASAMGSAPVLRGAVLHPPGTARTATGNGTELQLGAVEAGQKAYVSLHVYSISGTGTPTISVVVKSSEDNTFGMPTTRITFDDVTEVGAQLKSAAGPVTDEFWKVNWTISGTSPSFLFVAALGIG